MARNNFFIRTDGLLKKINLDEIVFLESTDNYVNFYRSSDYFKVRVSLDTALEQMKDSRFIRVHRSYAVSLDHIASLGRDSVMIVTNYKVELPVSKQYYRSVLKKIKIIGNSRV